MISLRTQSRLAVVCTIASAALLTICVLIWARSYWYRDAAGYSARLAASFYAAKGQVRFIVQSPGFQSGAYWHSTALKSSPFDIKMGENFRYERNQYFFVGDTGPVAVVSREFTAPLWSIVGIFLLLTAASVLWVRRAQSRVRRAAGLCPACAYDLRATPDRCPECGHRVHSPNRQAGLDKE